MAISFFEIGHDSNSKRMDRENLMFLEGTDDAYFFDHILSSINASPQKVGLVTVGGKGEFPAKMKALTKLPNFTQGKTKGVIIIKDADESFEQSDNDLHNLFSRIFHVEIRHGNIAKKDNVNYGYFLLPGIGKTGDLEKLCLSTVEGSELEQRSEKFLVESKVPVNDHFHKRKAHVYLAGMAGEVSRGAGLGFKNGKFSDSHEILMPLKKFISEFVHMEN